MRILLMVLVFYASNGVFGKFSSKRTPGHPATSQKVLLICLDGLRWDFLQNNKNSLPNMIKLEQGGVSANYVQNVFPTNTFPNHYSIVTGLYPENHGIIDNQMYDEKTGEKFSMRSTDQKWWNQAEPIWVTNQKQGHESGLCYWPGFNVKIQGVAPTYVVENDKYGNPLIDYTRKMMPGNERVDLALSWLRKEGVTFAAVYFEHFDSKLHDAGSNIGSDAMNEIDSTFAYLKKQLDGLSLSNSVNVIVVGDHGGKDVNDDKMIRLKNYIDIRKYVTTALGKTFVSVYPKSGELGTIYNALVHAHPNMTVYRKADLPTYLHIKNNAHTAPLLLLADPGWLIDSDFENGVYFQGKEFHKGEHGYNLFNRDMNPGFFAFGPCFKKGVRVDKIDTIDLYPIMCQIIGINSRKFDASVEPMKALLESKCLQS